MKMKKRFFGILLSLLMVMGLMPGMSLTAYADTTYPLWVGGTQVTSENASNIDGSNKASYDADSNTLTLKGVSIDTGYEYNDYRHYSAGIYYKNNNDTLNKPLNVILQGVNSIGGSGISTGIYGGGYYGSFTFSGEGSLNTTGTSGGIGTEYGSVKIDSGAINASGTENESSGIYARGSITINGGNVEATGANYGIQSMNGVRISDGTVTANATNSNSDTGAAIYDGGSNGINITGGNVTANGTSSSGKAYGLFMGSSGSITIGAEITSLTVTGITSASKGTVKNSVAGMGWTTVEGTGEGTEIAVNTSGASLASYKKLLFPYIKPAATVTTVPTAKNLTHTGAAQELVTAGEASGGTMQYALGKDATTAPTDGWNTTIPTATEAGTYYVWYKVKGDDSHSDTQPKCIEVTINPADYSPAVSNKALSFTGQPQPLVTAGTVEGGTLEYALGTDANTAPADGWSTEIPTATEAGTYYVWYRIKGDANHNDVAPACIVVTITPAAAGTASDSDYTLLASMKTSGNKALKLKWTAVSGAEGYDVFFGDCGGECELKKTVTGLSCKIGKLKKGNAYKAFVKAWKTENGQKVYIGEASPDVHAVAGGKSNKFTNAKKISVKKKKLTVAVGGSKKIKASLKKFSNSRRYLNHTAKIRYFSSNRAVATVNAKGKATGVAPGTCTVYAVAENGLRKGVKITVK